MGKHHLRKDKTCENCGHIVEERYCTCCGQENVETRQTFGHLVRHFMEDLTHYESNVWKTFKYLLFRPAYLTKAYLSGKRMTYVPPVKLYIFISFIAFFLPGFLPDFNGDGGRENIHIGNVHRNGIFIQDPDDDKKESVNEDSLREKYGVDGISSEFQYDSLQNSLPASQKDNFFERYFAKKTISINHMSKEEIKEKFQERMVHNFPKVLFLYLPLFAFTLWLFHSKKRWFYFDHAIFTLHFFSFLLCLITILNVIAQLIPWHYIIGAKALAVIFFTIIWLCSVIYFYRSHRKMYNEKWLVSWLLSTLVAFINSILFFIILIGFVTLTFVTA